MRVSQITLKTNKMRETRSIWDAHWLALFCAKVQLRADAEPRAEAAGLLGAHRGERAVWNVPREGCSHQCTAGRSSVPVRCVPLVSARPFFLWFWLIIDSATLTLDILITRIRTRNVTYVRVRVHVRYSTEYFLLSYLYLIIKISLSILYWRGFKMNK